MSIWGGWSGDDDYWHHFRDGARYDPTSDQWRPMTSKGAPEPREDHTVVWTGTEMLVWGGVVHEYGKARANPIAKIMEASEASEASDADEDAPDEAFIASVEAEAEAEFHKDELVQLATGRVGRAKGKGFALGWRHL